MRLRSTLRWTYNNFGVHPTLRFALLLARLPLVCWYRSACAAGGRGETYRYVCDLEGGEGEQGGREGGHWIRDDGRELNRVKREYKRRMYMRI